MADILAIISKAIFERDAIANYQLLRIGDVWPIDRYVSAHKSFNPLREGGRIFLVTVRPPDEELWLVGVVDSPIFENGAWVGRSANTRPITNISSLKRTMMFASGRGLSQDPGTLGMSLQTPRVLTEESSAAVLALVGGARPPPRAMAPSMMTASPAAGGGGAPFPSILSATTAADIEEPAVRSKREEIVQATVDQAVVLFDKMQETFGLRFPESLAYAVGFLKALSPDERADVEQCTGKLAGPATWFDPPITDGGGDERLHDRVATDPPEFVTVLISTLDPVLETRDERWGLWYDDSDELPTGIAHRTIVSDEPGFETRLIHPTLLEVIRDRINHKVRSALSQTPSHEQSKDEIASAKRWRVISHFLTDVIHRQQRCEQPTIKIHTGSSMLAERMNPYLENVPEMPLDVIGYMAKNTRRDAYLTGASDVDEWIEQARSELRDGAPARALLLGRELNAFQGYESARKWRFEASELLIRSYLALGRRPLADIVRVTYQNDAPSLPVYVSPAPHPIVSAADHASADADAIANALSESAEAPSADDLEAALVAPHLSIEALDALLTHARDQPRVTDTALWRRMQMLFRSRKAKDIAHHRKLALRLLARGTVNARAFARILRSGDAELIKHGAAHVNLESLMTHGDHAGATPLHLAARAAAPAVVKTLLERGADPKTKNADSRMAYDSAREAQIENPNDPGTSEVLAMLQLAGGGMAKPPMPASEEIEEYEEGDEVHHGKLGDGVVESVTEAPSGEASEAKLKIRFDNETRTLLAKFVTRKLIQK